MTALVWTVVVAAIAMIARAALCGTDDRFNPEQRRIENEVRHAQHKIRKLESKAMRAMHDEAIRRRME